VKPPNHTLSVYSEMQLFGWCIACYFLFK